MYEGEEADVIIYVRFKDENEDLQLIKGNPYKCNFIVSNQENDFNSENVKNYISSRLDFIRDFISKIKNGIDTEKNKYLEDRFALLQIKENIQRLEGERETLRIDLDQIYQMLNYFNSIRKPMNKQKELTKKLIKGLSHL